MLKLLPRDETFYDEMEKLSDLAQSSAQTMDELVKTFPSTDGLPGQIEQRRCEATTVMQETLLRLDQAFITPLDCEDIMQLITDLYGVIDRIAAVAERFGLFQLKELYPNLRQQSDTLRRTAEQLNEIITNLRHDKKLPELTPNLNELRRLQEEARKNRSRFLSELFVDHADPIDIMKKKELHDLLEGAITDCDNVARTLGRVLLKNG